MVAFALAGRVDIDLAKEPVAINRDGQPVYLRDIWPTHEEVAAVMEQSIKQESFKKIYGSVFEGDANWKSLRVPTGDLYAWDPNSTYVKHPPYFIDMSAEPERSFKFSA